jgi:nitroimidazol reductase NimA-like FMN-containing flavoprotein (pyridoxamine 5'-phosphate oxidase superfamily)
MEAELQVLDVEACIELLREHSVGRIAVIENEFPVILPVNFKLVETTNGPAWIAIRTRRGNVLDRAPIPAAFEIDGYDVSEQHGWSVLVRGTLHHVHPETGDFAERFDPKPWVGDDRDAWLIIEPFAYTGRRLRSPQHVWAFHPEAYL